MNNFRKFRNNADKLLAGRRARIRKLDALLKAGVISVPPESADERILERALSIPFLKEPDIGHD